MASMPIQVGSITRIGLHVNNPTRSKISDSETNHDQESMVVSDSESCNSGCSSVSSNQFLALNDGLYRLSQRDKVHGLIKRKFLAGLGSLGPQSTVVAIHRNTYSSIVGQAKMQSFHILTKAMEQRRGGNANIKYAWFGASRDEISKVLKHGFSLQMIKNNGLYGSGIYFSPDDSAMECIKDSAVDKDGIRHLLLCRLLLGKPEVVHPGSEQFHPSSEEFDSGVDNLASPRKYIVWSTHMNTHILPEYVISFRAPYSLRGSLRTQDASRVPTSPWMPFADVISALSELLPPTTVGVIEKCYRDHREKKISRQELIKQLRRLAGDKLLISLIKSFRNRQLQTRRRMVGDKNRSTTGEVSMCK